MEFHEFRDKIRHYFRIDLESYKENQLRRRIDNFMHKYKAQNYAEFFDLIQTKQTIYEAFLNHLTINVSEFFRDPKKFNELETIHLPKLLKRTGTLKIWSAACSIGAEPYSMAIILDQVTPRAKHTILGTDVDRNILSRAALGSYSPDAVKNVSKDRIRQYFTFDGKAYVINKTIRDKVKFKHHDLLQDRYETGFDLIMCRNVTIYFTRTAQDRVNENFVRSLKTGGILFIGGSEMIFNYRQLGLEKISHGFYQKA